MTAGISGMRCQSDHDRIKPMKKIYAYLNGGLGNQMFQYSTARALALRTGAELVLDTWSGFVRDKLYHRSYELHYLPIQARVATALERAPIWLFRAENRMRRLNMDMFQRRIYGNFLVESEFRFLEELIHYHLVADAWLVGYWQSNRYFQDYSAILCAELMPPRPTQKQFLDIGQKLRETESVALGIRLYEESANPSVHAKNGLMKSMAEVNSAIARLLVLQPNAKFFVFCTHRAPILAELNLPGSTIFLTHDDNYEGSLERLWLLTQCKHHIFTNSSYYWWGTWLSQNLYSATYQSQYVFAADSFFNKDGLCAKWEKF
jgi:hypothetical protein